MNSSNYRFTLDLHSTQSQVSIPASVGDTSRTLYISLSDGGSPYFIEDGKLAMLSIKRPTGTSLNEFCIIEGNAYIKYPFSQNENTCAVEGIHDCQIALYDAGGNVIAAPRFTMVVSDRVISSDDITISDEDRSEIDAMLAQEAARQIKEGERQTAETARKKRFDEMMAQVSKVVPVATEITLLASAWSGSESPYSQVVAIPGVTARSKVDLQIDAELAELFHDKDLALVTENEDGEVTVYAIGDKPSRDYTVQAVVTGVTMEGDES
jgi:hypothetical protein